MNKDFGSFGKCFVSACTAFKRGTASSNGWVQLAAQFLDVLYLIRKKSIVRNVKVATV
jgi:hypothetical protein